MVKMHVGGLQVLCAPVIPYGLNGLHDFKESCGIKASMRHVLNLPYELKAPCELTEPRDKFRSPLALRYL